MSILAMPLVLAAVLVLLVIAGVTGHRLRIAAAERDRAWREFEQTYLLGVEKRR